MRGVAYSLAERELLMRMHQQGKSLSVLSRETGIARAVLSRWWMRYQEQGRAGLEPRSRRPNRSPGRLALGVRTQILQLRKRGWGPARIALVLGIGHSSVHRVLVRHGRNRLRLPEQKTIRRYEKSRPGELVHLDLKYLYRWKKLPAGVCFCWCGRLFPRSGRADSSGSQQRRCSGVFGAARSRIALSDRSGDDRQRLHLHHALCVSFAAADPLPAGLPELGHRTLAGATSAPRIERKGRTILSDSERGMFCGSSASLVQDPHAGLGRISAVLQS